MRTYPEDESDRKDIDELNAEPWMIEILKKNPDYVFWGNFEDYMIKEGHGWDSRLQFNSWKEFGPWNLDEYNEVANFYFEVSRNSKECDVCEGTGYNEGTKKIHDTFYAHMNPKREHWNDKITQDEFEALKEHDRCREFSTVEEVNRANTHGESFQILGSHDAINNWILVETRAKRLGMWGKCTACGGNGYLFTEDKGHLDLQLWILHPRKGCSRGVYIKNIKEEELLEVIKFLKEAAKRNAERFSML